MPDQPQTTIPNIPRVERCPGSNNPPDHRSAINGEPAGYCAECGTWRKFNEGAPKLLVVHDRYVTREQHGVEPEQFVKRPAVDELFVIEHGAIESVLGTDPPRLLMRYPSGERYEVDFTDRDTDCRYIDAAGNSNTIPAGMLVDELQALVKIRQDRDEARSWLSGGATVETRSVSLDEAQRLIAEGSAWFHVPPTVADVARSAREARDGQAAIEVIRDLIAGGTIEFDVELDQWVATDNDRYSIDPGDGGWRYAMLEDVMNDVERDERERRAKAAAMPTTHINPSLTDETR